MGRKFGIAMDLKNYITEKQQHEICSIIQMQCRRFQEMEREYRSLFYEPYISMRQKYSVTTAVLSGFTPHTAITGFKISIIHYGLHGKLAQPELKSERAILQIYSNGSNLNARVFKERCATYNEDFSTLPVFIPVVFYADEKGNLRRINAILPNKDGIQVEQFSLYTRPKLEVVGA